MKFLTRKLITHTDLNPRGYLHGGQLLKWIDEEGGIHAGLELNTGLIVTKMISEIDFRFPSLNLSVLPFFTFEKAYRFCQQPPNFNRCVHSNAPYGSSL